MNEVLKDYTIEEIEQLAIKQLNSDDNISLKIVKVDKEYKKHNITAVKNAIMNGAVIFICAGIVLNSESSISEFGTEDLSSLFNSLMGFVSHLPYSDLLVSMYAKMFDGINYIIENLGLFGIILASKSINFLTTTLKDTRKSLKIKKELEELKEQLKNIESSKKTI